MAEFDESKVINALHPEKVEIGKRYWFADTITSLKEFVEGDQQHGLVHILSNIRETAFPFEASATTNFALVYPYEEPSEELMSNRQMAEWVARGNGQYTSTHWTTVYTEHDYHKNYADDKVPDHYRICPWGSDEWVVPTVAIYERDCK